VHKSEIYKVNYAQAQQINRKTYKNHNFTYKWYEWMNE